MERQTLPTTKCVLCLRPTEKMSDENTCRQQKIADVYMIYLKPKLGTIAAYYNFVSLLKERTSNCQFCSDCTSAGQNLTSMNDQLLALQCAIQGFVQNLLEEIIKYRKKLDTRPHQQDDSVPPNYQQFSDYSAHEIEIKKEAEIKKEVEMESIDVEENIYNQESLKEQDDHLENHVGSQDPVGYHVDSNDANSIKDQACSDIAGKNSGLTNENELSFESNITKNPKKRKQRKRDILRNIQSRKLVTSWQPQCSKCDKSLTPKEPLKGHMVSDHPKTKGAFCAVCPDLKKFTDQYEYEIHIMTHTEEIPYDCPKCHVKFSNAKNYCDHQTSSDCANSNGLFVCVKCDELFKAKCLLLTHTTVFHKANEIKDCTSLQCDLCESLTHTTDFHKANEENDYTFLQCDLCESLPMMQCCLEDHYAEHTEEFIIPCDICGMSLQNLAKFDEHRKTHRSSVGLPYSTFDKMLLEEGDNDDEDVIKYSCEFCNRKFIDETKQYLSHIKTCHCKSLHICDICGKKFSYPDRLANHRKGHIDGFPTCTKCNKQFETELKLKAHVEKRKSLEDECELNPPVAAKKRKLDKNESSKLEQNSKDLLEESGLDMDIDGNENKSIPNKSTKKKKNKSLMVVMEKKINQILSGENISLDEDNADGNLECTVCSVKFSDWKLFESHLFDNHKETTFQCKHCKVIFLNGKDKDRHIQWAHPKNDLLCAVCPDLEKFPNLYEFEIHCMTHTEEIPYDCPTCHKKFSHARKYCEHQKSSACANSRGQFKCTKCEAVFVGKCLLLAHMTVVHKGKGGDEKDYSLFQCELCKKPHMQKFSLEDHYAEHTKEWLIPCDICGMRLQSFAILNVHRKLHRGTVAIPCGSCDLKFKNMIQLRTHMKMNHTEGQVVTDVTCEHCGAKFIGATEKYTRHVETCSKFLNCKICGKRFMNSDRFAKHMKGHTDGFPTCLICNKEFESVGKLKAHSNKMHSEEQTVIDEAGGVATSISKASGEGPVQEEQPQNLECDICGEKISGTLKKHKQLFHKLKNIPCPYCPEMFANRVIQKNHEDSYHWEVRNINFQCQGCEQIFMRERLLEKHEKLMHPELRTLIVNRTCPICKKVLHDASGLKSHMNYKHAHEMD